jgi:hypothetical protein
VGLIRGAGLICGRGFLQVAYSWGGASRGRGLLCLSRNQPCWPGNPYGVREELISASQCGISRHMCDVSIKMLSVTEVTQHIGTGQGAGRGGVTDACLFVCSSVLCGIEVICGEIPGASPSWAGPSQATQAGH